jgi:coenzyme PQQ precursor peptide PqqA
MPAGKHANRHALPNLRMIRWTARRWSASVVHAGVDARPAFLRSDTRVRRHPMSWTRPKLREICIGMEINGYFAGKL